MDNEIFREQIKDDLILIKERLPYKNDYQRVTAIFDKFKKNSSLISSS